MIDQLLFISHMSVSCNANGGCPFLYYCDTSSNLCYHEPVIPFTVYPLIIYLIFPVCSALCNLSGNSFGEYKVLMIMDLLNYSAPAATVLTYPLIAGTALFNFFNLIPKRHPSKNTSLVDYNIVMVLIPNILFGSTIGALVNFFIPQIASDAIVMPLLGAFSIKFFFRFRQFRAKQKLQQQEQEIQKAKELIELNRISKNDGQRQSKNGIDQQESKNQQQNSINQQLKQRISSSIAKQKQLRQQILNKQVSYRLSLFSHQQKQLDKPQQSIKKKQILKYQQSWHIPHVIATIIIFVIFQIVSFIAQGKIFHFTICEYYYGVGLGCFTIFYLVFIMGMYRFTCWQMNRYRQIQYDYDGRLDEKLRYIFVCLSGFIGGFNAGVFGLASSTSMIFALLFLKIQPAVVSATIGFQVVFVGLATLGQAFVRAQISYAVAGFFFGLTFVFGGILTFIFRLILKRFNIMKVNQVLMLIVCSLCGCSTLALIVNIILGFVTFGKNYMLDIKFSC